MTEPQAEQLLNLLVAQLDVLSRIARALQNLTSGNILTISLPTNQAMQAPCFDNAIRLIEVQSDD